MKAKGSAVPMKNLKSILTILVLVGIIVWGHFKMAGFDNYLTMIGLISFLVIAHELGHFTVAKKLGVKVERFGFGLPFGPTLFEKKFGETTYCLHAALLGGYVSFPDDDPESDVPPDSPRRFENKPVWARAAIAMAGVTVNFIVGYLIMVGVIAFFGYPGDYHVKVQDLLPGNTPALQAGLKPGDLFLKAGDQPIKTPDKLVSYLHTHAGQTIPLVIERNNVEKTLDITPNKDGKISVALSLFHKYEPVHNPIQIATKAFTFLSEKIVMNFQAMGEIFTGKRSTKELSGPIGIVKQGGMMIQIFGIAEGLVITALISVILAVMNILPLPMLDGGHLLFMAIEKIQGHPVKKEVQERVVQVSFFVLMGLMVVILWNDVSTYILGH